MDRSESRCRKNVLNVTVSETLLSVLPLVRNLFDLYCSPNIVYESIQTMNDIRSGLCVSGTRLPGSFDIFETAVGAILKQRGTANEENNRLGSFVRAYGGEVQTGIEGLTHVFPRPEAITALKGSTGEQFALVDIGVEKHRTIVELGRAIEKREIEFSLPANPAEEMKKLLEISGLTVSMAKYIAARTMGWTDIFFEVDNEAKKVLGLCTPEELSKLTEIWKPWRSYAAMNVWNYTHLER